MSDRSRTAPSGAFNFRDLGGLRTREGRCVRRGVLFRSDTLQALTQEDVAFLVDDLRLELVVDLRSGQEAVAQGRGLLASAAVCYLNSPLTEAKSSNVPADEQALAYSLDHIASPQSLLATVVRILCAQAGRPALVHCAAGKDRTGLVSALLLKLLGVDEEEIVLDYLRTAQAMPRIMERFEEWSFYREHMRSVPPELYRAEEHTIRGLLTGLEERHGGAETWALTRGIGLDDIDRLRRALLEPVPAGQAY
ncbi:tyrosine-protein phosphatase [Pseudonocardia xishanensis]|uniref:Tyrosine specific protein phosphatases domain-containing protein n=1 Tax=Pseudonocardia xishanensis TaxID=630995 RepID=A0ABP8RVD1_9PSEU